MGGWNGFKSVIKNACCGDCTGHHHRHHNPNPTPMARQGVRLTIQDQHVIMDNGICQVTISNPDGHVTGIQYGTIDNLLENLNTESNRGYWDVVWSALDGSKKGGFEILQATIFKVIVETDEQVELSFSRPWNPAAKGNLVPLHIDKRYIMLRGCAGFYTYAIYEHVGAMEWPAFSLGETRIAFKLRKDKFNYMAVSDTRRRFMPSPDDRLPGRGQPLAYAEAVLLINPIEPEFKGEVDDKYQYSSENKDLRVHGWISMDPGVGFWQICASEEFRTGGPTKQNLSSHVGPSALSVFHSAHYAGEDLNPTFGQGEPWKKVFGPVFCYLNSVMSGKDPLSLWDDAKRQMLVEVQSWPYTFPASEDFLKADQRGNIFGRLIVEDRYNPRGHGRLPASGAYVVLAPPGPAGYWQRECKHYQFWSTTDEQGYFAINHVRTGDYNLYAWVPGYIGDYRNDALISITPGYENDMGDLVFVPPRNGPTLWEIGIPDRSAAEFYVPEPDPKYVNRVLSNNQHERFRQYGLWERYSQLFPKDDLVFTIGESDYRTDWFFAQVTRKIGENTYQGTTWQVKFKLDNVDQKATYKLLVALAGATFAELQIRINDPQAEQPLFSSGLIGKDNSIARHGIHGIYWLFTVDVKGNVLVKGDNIIYLGQPRCANAFQYVMYDYIRLEGPPQNPISSDSD